MITSAVPAEHVPLVWQRVASLLEPALRSVSGRYDVNDVLRELQENKTSLWIAFDQDGGVIHGAAVVRLVDYPKRRFARIEIVGGERMRNWGDRLLDMVESYARSSGCVGIETGGRVGWSRLGAARGYKKTSFHIEKEFQDAS